MSETDTASAAAIGGGAGGAVGAGVASTTVTDPLLGAVLALAAGAMVGGAGFVLYRRSRPSASGLDPEAVHDRLGS
jgi:hypothetical protein